MKRWIIRIVAGIALVVLAALIFVWSVLAIPYFSDFRSRLVADVLTEQIGQPLLVTEDVSVVVAPVSRIRASGVKIPSETMNDVDLAKLDRLEFNLDLMALWNSKVDINDLIVDGLTVSLLTKADNSTSWSDREQSAVGSYAVGQDAQTDAKDAPSETQTENLGLLNFLKTRRAAFSSIQLIIDNDVTGFEFDFELSELSLTQQDQGTTLGVTSSGTVNGRPFSLQGTYPEAEPFTTMASFSSATLTFNGNPVAADDGDGDGFEGDLRLEVAAINDLMEVLKLKSGNDGSATLKARITNRLGSTAISDLSTVVALDKGQTITLNGNVANVGQRKGFDLDFDARLYPEGNPPAPANGLDELKLTKVSTRIVSEGEALELDELLISTNGFQQGLDRVGPVSIGKIRRTEDGTLAFEDISIQSGPLETPYLMAQGSILNILGFSEIDLSGQFNIPATVALSSHNSEIADSFGRVTGAFSIDDSAGALGVDRLSMQTADTDVWSMTTEISVADVTTLGETRVDLDLNIQDGAEFLKALQLKPVDTGKLSFSLDIEGDEGAWQGAIGLGAGTSALTGKMSFSNSSDGRTVKASIVSESMVIDDLKNAVTGVLELDKFRKKGANPEEHSEVPLQPLVLPAQAPAPSDADTQNKPVVELQPLVIEKEPGDLIDPDRFLRETDIYGEIDFKKISGVKGITSVSSEFVSEGGQAKLGPLEFNYGGGYFNLQASADVVDAPRYVSVSGATSGWNLADILKTVGVDFDASGDLSGRFSVAGNLETIQTYISSMHGSASVNMSNGQIATSLLELAGLGVFPWLFSQERRQGYTDITCLSIPLKFDPGAVRFDPLVAETDRVQLVARGAVDWRDNSISLRAEPRPLGRPLARSAWPFDVTGKLSDPKFKLDVGGSRSRRADGATRMPANRKPCSPDILQLQ